MAPTVAKPDTAISAPQEKKEKKNFVAKPEKPDEEQFKRDLAQAEKEHDEAKAKLNAIKEKLSLAQPPRQGEPNPTQARQNELRSELATIRNKQQARKTARQKTMDQVKSLDNALKVKINEYKNARGKIPYKSVEEIDRAITNLEKQVESGRMKLVDEKKALNDISLLKRQRKTFDTFAPAQAAIDADKAKIAEVKNQLDDPEAKALSDRFTEVTAELDKIKAQQDEVYKNLSTLRDERINLMDIEREKFQAKKAIEDTYYKARIAYRDYERQAIAVRREKFRAEREAKEREHRKQVARQKMEEASTPAFGSEILTCEGLIAHFDPNSPEALATKTKSALLQDRGLKATDIRTVTAELKGVKLVAKEDREEDYFVGAPAKGRKGKKGGNRNGSAAGTGSNTPNPDDKGKFQLNHGILAELGKVDAAPPSGWDDVPRVLEKLREKLIWYKENSERVTKENIEKARREIEKLEADEAAANSPTSDYEKKEYEDSEEATATTEQVTEEAGGESPTEPLANGEEKKEE